MEVPAASGNGQRLLKPIGDIGGRRTSVNEIVSDGYEESIHSNHQKLDR